MPVRNQNWERLECKRIYKVVEELVGSGGVPERIRHEHREHTAYGTRNMRWSNGELPTMANAFEHMARVNQWCR